MKTFTLESLQELHGTDRLHFTSNRELSVIDGRAQETGGARPSAMKPKGFWYSGGNDWARWSVDEWFRVESLACVYRIHMDESRILLVTSVPELLQLAADFKMPHPLANEAPELFSDAESDYMNWALMAERYAGVEIIPYQWECRLSWRMWYYAWDCASGCVWDASAIKDIELLGAFDPGPEPEWAGVRKETMQEFKDK